MPETPMNKDRDSVLPEDNVRAAGQLPGMEAKPQSCRMQVASNRQLGSGMRRSDSGHHSRASRRAHIVSHDCPTSQMAVEMCLRYSCGSVKLGVNAPGRWTGLPKPYVGASTPPGRARRTKDKAVPRPSHNERYNIAHALWAFENLRAPAGPEEWDEFHSGRLPEKLYLPDSRVTLWAPGESASLGLITFSDIGSSRLSTETTGSPSPFSD